MLEMPADPYFVSACLGLVAGLSFARFARYVLKLLREHSLEIRVLLIIRRAAR